MRKIKAQSNYLKNQTLKNLVKAALCLLIFGTVFLGLSIRIIYTKHAGVFEAAGLIFLLSPLIASYFYLRKYHIFRGGWEGEKQVASYLNNALNDDYYLINDLYLQGGEGDIDHVVLAPNGVFVLETKNWRGSISCNDDEWQRNGKRTPSPSRQVKRNATKVKRIIDTSANLRLSGIWVKGIVVFTNRHANFHLNSPTVPSLKLEQLPNFLTTHKSKHQLSRSELETIGKEITKQKS